MERVRTASSEGEKPNGEDSGRRVYVPTFAKSFDRRETSVRPVSARTYQQLLSPGEDLYLHENGLYGDETKSQQLGATDKTFAEKRRSARLKGTCEISLTHDSPSGSEDTSSSAADVDSLSSQQASPVSQLEKKLEARGIKTVYDPTSEITPDEDPVSPSASLELPSPFILSPNTTLNERMTFLLTPGNRQHTFACFILRDRSQSKTYPKYRMYADDGGVFLLSARRRKKSRSSNYIISLGEDELARNSPYFFGKVRSNFIGTQFTIYDNGEKVDSANTEAVQKTRKELGAVLYEHNVLGTRGPRRMTALVPKHSHRNANTGGSRPARSAETCIQRRVFFSLDCMTGLGNSSRYLKDRDNVENADVLVNKTPKWNDQVIFLNLDGWQSAHSYLLVECLLLEFQRQSD